MESNDKAKPTAISKIRPAKMTSRTSVGLFAAFRLAIYLVIAVFTPISRNKVIVSEGINATLYNPYSAGDISLVRIIVPIAIITVDVATPMSKWKLPVTEVFPISNAFSTDSQAPLVSVFSVGCRCFKRLFRV
jgi:hypothetical protein